MLIRTLVLVAALLAATPAVSQPSETADTDAIRHVMRSTWDKPSASVEVSPVIVVADYAIAGWTQEAMGGRALLRRKGADWIVLLCAGDQLKHAEPLRMAGIPPAVAGALVTQLAAAEQTMQPERVAMFSRFEGLVTIEGHDRHGH